MLHQQTGFAVDEKHLLYAIQQAVKHDDFSKRPPCPRGLQTPLQALQAEAVGHGLLKRLRHALQRCGDGLADGGANDGEDRVGQHLRVAAY